MKAVLNGQIIAESNDTVIVESNHYFPISSVRQQFLIESDRTTVCSWKGKARYYNVIVGENTIPDAAFYYTEPREAAASIRDRVAFWRGVEVTP